MSGHDEDPDDRRRHERRSRLGDQRQSVVLEMIQTIDDKHDEGHRRLRQDYRSMERRVAAVEQAQIANALHFTRLETPPDITKLQFPGRVVLTIALGCIGLGFGQWTLNARLENNVMKAIEQNAKVQDERYAIMQKAIESLRNRVELSQVELNTFKENLLRDRRMR